MREARATLIEQLTVLRDLAAMLWNATGWEPTIVIRFRDIPALEVQGIPLELVAPAGAIEFWGRPPRGVRLEGGYSINEACARLVALVSRGGQN